tara:strand:+ start:107 stop:724 length:618 start_codon:yes stop_codon:yes gene_type:complete
MVDLAKLGLKPEKGLDPAFQEAVANHRSSMDRPIPGESLTNDPDNLYPFEGPPEYTDRTDALEYLFVTLTEKETHKAILNALYLGTPVMNLTEILLYKGFSEGKWNPDLFVILIEPTAYMIMALAERAGIDFKIIKDEDDPDLTEEEKYGKPEKDDYNFNLFGVPFEKSKLKEMDTKVSKTSLPKEISEKIEKVSLPDSLMAKTT